MKISMLHARFGAALFALTAGSIAHAQCLEWEPGFEAAGLHGWWVSSLATFDGGSGPELYAGGLFHAAGDLRVNNIARWNGSSWSPVGTGVPDGFGAMLTFDDGSGPALYIAGDFDSAGGVPATNFARWDGSSWSAVGNTAASTSRMVIHDDGSGPAIYLLGSSFQRWDGTTLSSAGAGPGFFVKEAAVFDDGSGESIYVGNDASPWLRRWNGSSWVQVGSGISGAVRALAVFDDGNGPALYAAGSLALAGGNPVENIARWDGTAWTALGAPGSVPFSQIWDLYAFDDGTGMALFVGGTDTTTGPRRVRKWDGTSWTIVGDIPAAITSTFQGSCVLGSHAGDLVVGGRFERAGDAAAMNIARFDGANWSAFSGPTKSIGGKAQATAVFDDGNGPALYVGGRFVAAGDIPANSIARFDGTSWSDVGGGFRYAGGIADIYALLVWDDGGGEALYAAGLFTEAGGNPAACVAKWDGVEWSALGNGISAPIRALEVFDDGFGEKLYAGGVFAGGVLRWTGVGWESLGAGTDTFVFALKTFSTNGVPELYVGGEFQTAGGLTSPCIAKWRGTWTSISSGSGGQVLALEVFAGGNGVPYLYAGGSYHGGLARWNGTHWSTTTPSGSWINVFALRVFDDGSGSGAALYAGGSFLAGAGVPDTGLAKWSGTTWSQVGGGIEQTMMPFTAVSVNALGVFDDDSDGRADLFVGGFFSTLGDAPNFVTASSFTKWKGCAGPGTPYCFGDSMATVDCPCAAPNVVPYPSGSAFGGCANSFNPHGAGLSAIGAINPDTVTLFAHGLSPSGFAVFFKSSGVVPAGVGVLDGVSCASGALIRFGSQNAVNGTAQYPNVPLGHTIPLSDRGATPVGSGLTGYYQIVYRNTAAGFCTADTLNFGSGYRITWN